MNSGVDISLWDNVFPQLEAAADQGLIKQETIDRSVMRVPETERAARTF